MSNITYAQEKKRMEAEKKLVAEYHKRHGGLK